MVHGGSVLSRGSEGRRSNPACVNLVLTVRHAKTGMEDTCGRRIAKLNHVCVMRTAGITELIVVGNPHCTGLGLLKGLKFIQ